MNDKPQLELGRLRDIGWEVWNPIGLDEAWRAAAPDEYDRYLLHGADMSAGGATEGNVAAYLIDIAAEHMGLTRVDPDAAAATASAIAAYVESTRQRR